MPWFQGQSNDSHICTMTRLRISSTSTTSTKACWSGYLTAVVLSGCLLCCQVDAFHSCHYPPITATCRQQPSSLPMHSLQLRRRYSRPSVRLNAATTASSSPLFKKTRSLQIAVSPPTRFRPRSLAASSSTMEEKEPDGGIWWYYWYLMESRLLKLMLLPWVSEASG